MEAGINPRPASVRHGVQEASPFEITRKTPPAFVQNLIDNRLCFSKIILFLKETDRTSLQLVNHHFYSVLIPASIPKCSILGSMRIFQNSIKSTGSALPPIFQQRHHRERLPSEWHTSEVWLDNDIVRQSMVSDLSSGLKDTPLTLTPFKDVNDSSANDYTP